MELTPVLTAEALGKKYGKHWAVKDVHFSLNKGDILGVIGENGAGKSTLLSMAATLARPTEGSISFLGEDIFKNTKTYRTRIGYVPQEIALFEELSGYDNLEFFAKSYRIPKDQIPERIKKVCRITCFPEEALKKRLSEYSGGMKRKINISAALLHEPELLLLDEPTANLDFTSEEQIVEAIQSLAKQGVTVIYVGHQMELMEQLCNKFCLLKDGRQLLFDTMDERLEKEGGSLKQLCRKYMES